MSDKKDIFKPFQIVSSDELVDLGLIDSTNITDLAGDYEYCNFLVEVFRDGRIARIIESDAGEPEDQTFSRNFRWIPDLLNEKYIGYEIELEMLQDQIKELQSANNSLISELEETKFKLSEFEARLEKTNKPAVDLGVSLRELERKERYKAIYSQAWEQAILAGASRQEAHEEAHKACIEAGVVKN